jgi:hypothetical protein
MTWLMSSYIVYLCVVAAYLVITYYMYPETKGHTIEEVSVIFDREPVAVSASLARDVEAWVKSDDEKRIEDVTIPPILYR